MLLFLSIVSSLVIGSAKAYSPRTVVVDLLVAFWCLVQELSCGLDLSLEWKGGVDQKMLTLRTLIIGRDGII